jgi:hypothetical protein
MYPRLRQKVARKVMATPNNDKHRQYANYAAHCLTMLATAGEADARDIQREMALEWIKLADAILHAPPGADLIHSPAERIIVVKMRH